MIMSKFVTALALVGALALAGCATTGNLPIPAGPVVVTPGQPPVVVPPGTTPGKVAEVIGKVQDATAKACKFVPTASTVANILAVLGVADLRPLPAVAQQICDAVVKRNAVPKAGRKPPTVAGVPIKGKFVR